jgi:lipopolysaccharide/colanic/teichoic acid biosynthesis glycosyltransferase
VKHQIDPYYISWKKRGFDIVLAILLLVGLSPLLTFLALLVWITAGRPIIFKQKRMGQNKRPFTMYKFRTMYLGAERHQHRYRENNQAPFPMFKIFNDPRFVGCGRFFSKTGLDELPQLLNILRGEMSFIGPRPLPINESKQLDNSWDFRYLAKPGVFSEWTLSPNRHVSLPTWKKLEQATLNQGSVLKDVKTIVKTLLRTT